MPEVLHARSAAAPRRFRFPVPVLVLAGLVAAAVAIGVLERRPSLEPAVGAPGHGRVHIAYWEKWGSFEREACEAMVDAFNASQDQVFVHYIPTSQVDRKAMLAIMGRDPPDVIGLWANNVAPFAAAGALQPLDARMAASGMARERYIANYLRLGMMSDTVYALPTTPASLGLYYNKAHFREAAGRLRAAGLDPERPPATTEEVDRYAEVLNTFDAGGRPLRMGFLPTEPGWFNWTWGYHFGGRLYDEAADRITADAPRNVEALLWCKRYAERYGRERLLQFKSGFGNFDSPQNAFIDGRVSMEVQGVWFSNFIRRHRPALEFGVAAPPVAPGVTGPVSMVECDVIAMPRGARHPEAAWRFIEYAQGEGLAILCRLQGKHMPLREPPPDFREGHPNLEVATFEALAASPHTFIYPRLRVWEEYRHELDKAFEHVWNWPVPESELAGLTGDARASRVDDLCREEIRRTLGDVRERMQRKHETDQSRQKLHGAVAGSRGP